MKCKDCGIELADVGSDTCPGCISRFYNNPSTEHGVAMAPPTPPPVSEPARSTIKFEVAAYEILRTLGVGGVGVVYLARERTTNKLFALKVLRPSLRKNKEVIARFRREVDIARKINHPNIARVFSFKEAEGQLFIVLEYIDGRDLGRYHKTVRPSLEQKLAIMKAVCSALDAAHAVGVIHRDLKPGNILIAKDGTPYVLDFGIASLDDDVSVTRPGSFIGTPLYVSPEQAKGQKVDERTDIYALGAIFYELVTGRPPFIADSPITIALKHIREKPFRPRSLDPSIPPIVENVILRCLEKDPSSRPQRASEIIKEIERPIEREIESARSSARLTSQEPGSGELRDISLFQYLRVLTPLKRNFVLEIVNNEEFGRYHFRGAHLVHGEAGNLRDEEVTYNLFYWTRGIYRTIVDAEPPPKETVSIPWIPFVESVFQRYREIMLSAHGAIQGPLILDLLDPRGTTLYRYCSDSRFEKALGDKARMSGEAFHAGRSHLKSKDLTKVSKTTDSASMLFCFISGLRHYLYALADPSADIEALYQWIKTDLEHRTILALHECMVASDRKRRSKRPVRILVAENEPFLGNLMRIKFKTLGADVYLMREGGRALEAMSQLSPDVIILNVNIPGVSGYDICRHLHSEPRTARIPIILLVPERRHDGVEENWPAGVVKVLGKPIILDELVEVVERYSKRRLSAEPELNAREVTQG